MFLYFTYVYVFLVSTRKNTLAILVAELERMRGSIATHLGGVAPCDQIWSVASEIATCFNTIITNEITGRSEMNFELIPITVAVWSAENN